MRRSTIIIGLLALVHTTGLRAQVTGDAANATAQAAKESSWQNWTFAGIAAVVAAGAIYFISTNNGNSAPDDE